MSTFFIKTIIYFPFFHCKRDLNLIPVKIGLFHAKTIFNRNINLCYFSKTFFNMILFKTKLFLIVHVLESATTTIFKDRTNWFYPRVRSINNFHKFAKIIIFETFSDCILYLFTLNNIFYKNGLAIAFNYTHPIMGVVRTSTLKGSFHLYSSIQQ